MLSSARYSYVYKKVTEFIKENAIVNFPIDTKKIANNKGWVTYSYCEAEFLGMPKEYCYKIFGKNGGTSPDDGDYIIFYNDNLTENVEGRIRFTIAHEVGHIYLNHFSDFDCANISKEESKYLENEASCFARNVLSPIVLVDYLNLSESNIVNAFGVSDAAATTRLKLKHSDMYWTKSCDYNLVLEHFKPFIKKIRSDFDMIYPGYEVNEQGQLIKCIHCQNEEIEVGAYYCKICGASVVNECSHPNCRRPSDSNARYCILCGYGTTFYEQGLLPAQEEAAVAINNDFLGPL